MAAENGQTRSSMGSSMSNSADIFNLMDNLLPRADCVEMVEPDELQRLYAGRRQKLSATPDLSGTVLPLCLIPNSALKSAPPFKSVLPKASACAGLPA
ncbi:hypothetical protein N5O82_18215 [Stutzerimonas stutzeri]|uniref:hypothetical protein n=1 Tax=Stutzerimonas stutzeri TaxID=316 RepID=UPI002440FAD6|nr:hypothetical protein [Stutzerimonas stutzeri]WGG19133.1 hypothetical protein N5O82_18215 [Stutzerimonas stutzeri]